MLERQHQQCRDSSASLDDIISCIRDGHNILILMRGVPGSGKTYTARKLGAYSAGAEIFSTDDFFYDREGNYKWDQTLLDEYHKKNVARARDAMKNNTKLVIIDNTNISVDHMRPYVHHAVKHYYEVYVVEPESEWREKANICAKNNVHGVTKAKISQMLDEMSIEKTISLQALVGKTVQTKLSLIQSDEADCDQDFPLTLPPEYPRPISFSPPPGLPVPGVSAGINFASTPAMEKIIQKCFSMSPVITSPKVATPVLEKSFLSLALANAEPTKRVVEQRTVQTQFSEVMIPLAEAGIISQTQEFLEVERTSCTYSQTDVVDRKDRPAPGKGDSEELVPLDDMDLLVSLFPFELAEDLKHYYDNVGLTMTIQIFHEIGNTYTDYDAFVVKGAYLPFEEMREPLHKPFRGERDEFNHLSLTDDVKVEIRVSDLKTILSILFGTGDGNDIPEYLSVNISLLLQLYKQATDREVGYTNMELDEKLARELNAQNINNTDGGTITMSQRIQYLSLIRDYPEVDKKAMFHLFIDNRLNSEHTRAVLNAQFDPPAPAPPIEPSPIKPLQRKVLTTSNDLKSAQAEATKYFEKSDELNARAQVEMLKGQRPFKLGGTHYRAEGSEFLKEVERLRNKGNEILKQANLNSDVMDFHKMSVTYALETLKEKLLQYDNKTGKSNFQCNKKISVITGAGKSLGSRGVIKKEVISFLRKHKYSYYLENDGKITIYCRIGDSVPIPYQIKRSIHILVLPLCSVRQLDYGSFASDELRRDPGTRSWIRLHTDFYLPRRRLVEFTIYLRHIDGAPWKHIILLEKLADSDGNYYEQLFPMWFRAKYLTFRGNGLSTEDNIAEFCGSISNPQDKPTRRELLQLLSFKKFIASYQEKFEICRLQGLEFVEKGNVDLHDTMYSMGKKMGFKGGSWCVFPLTKNGVNSFEENTVSMKTMINKLLGNLFGADCLNTAWSHIWRLSLRVYGKNVMAKLSNNYSSYFDDIKQYGYDVEHDEIWFYRRDEQVKSVFRLISQHANYGKFYFRYKPEMLSMCGIRKENMKGTVLSLYGNIPNQLLLKPERTDYKKEQKPSRTTPGAFDMRYYKSTTNPHNRDSVNHTFDYPKRRQ